tara:strand:+ start:244 stop:432 length:189 start_codon:yes stop_codon:yes gene_type:complete
MEKKQLSENDKAFLRFLKQEVDYWEKERWRDDASSNATNNYYQAKEELKDFKAELRKKGYNI